MRLGITKKLMVIMIPLVVLPVLFTGFVTYQVAEDLVTDLLNQAQINLAREIAERAGQDFKTAKADLGIISALPALSDYHYNRFYGLASEAEISRKHAEKFFLDLARKSPLYHRIAYVDSSGRQVVNITQKGVGRPMSPLEPGLPAEALARTASGPHVSKAMAVGPNKHRVIRHAQPLYDVWDRLSGVVVLDLDFDELSKRILSRRVGTSGYAFVVDNRGVVQVHPERAHLGKGGDKLGLPSVQRLIEKMLRQGQGMASYEYGRRKIAAYTPIGDIGWIVAVTLPVSEFKQRVDVIGDRVLLIVAVAASLALGGGIFFSWGFVRPIKKLAEATNVISEGRLPKRIEPESQDELGALTSSFNQMVRNLRRIQGELVKSEKLVSLGRLATGVAHEIRNPLNAMKVAAEVLKRKKAYPPDTHELVGLIYREISHLDNFVTNFLSYARQPPPKLIDVDINQLTEDVLGISKARMSRRGIRLDRRLDPSNPRLYLDPFQMERALHNIVTNAVDAMPGGGALGVYTRLAQSGHGREAEKTVEVRISDSGKGMQAEQLKNVFDPFYTTKEKGTGLGLSLTKGIVEAHGGSLAITSSPGAGTEVVVRLPLDGAGPAGEDAA